MAEIALEEAHSAMLSGHYDMIILDEINVAVHLGLNRASRRAGIHEIETGERRAGADRTLRASQSSGTCRFGPSR